MFDHRLVGAEALKLYRRPGMIALCLVLTLGIDLVVFAVTGIQHATDPAKYAAAGGLANYQGSIALLTMLVLVAGAIVGSTAGAQDIEAGVFRDLAATGRSRLALFGARVPGAWAIVLPIAAIAAATAAILSFALAGGLAGPDAGTIVAGTFGVLAAAALSSAVAVGFAALTGSKAPVIATMLAFVLAIGPLLGDVTFLGDARMALPGNALARIAQQPHLDPAMGLATAVAIVLAWAAAAFAGGAWKTSTREI